MGNREFLSATGLPGGARSGLAGALPSLLLCAVWVLEVVRMVHDGSALRSAGAACLAAFSAYAWFRASIHIRAMFLAILLACTAASWSLGSADAMVSGVSRASSAPSSRP